MKLTAGQKLFMYQSLRDQKSTKTPAEAKLYAELREELADNETLSNGAEILIIDGHVKEINQDTFGDVYRFGWCKIKETSKGDYYYSNYYRRRMYL